MSNPPIPASAPTSMAAPKPPSAHVRAIITWIAIFPLVYLGMATIAPFSEEWPPVLKALVLTVVVVPVAVYWVVPQLFRLHGAFIRRG